MTALKNMDKFLSPQLTSMVKGWVAPCAQGARWHLEERRSRACGQPAAGTPPAAAQAWLPGHRPPAAGGAAVPRADRALAAARWWPSRAAAAA